MTGTFPLYIGIPFAVFLTAAAVFFVVLLVAIWKEFRG